MPLVVKSGNTYKIYEDTAISYSNDLKPLTYAAKVDPFGQFYLEEMEDFKPLKKYYGNTLQHADRIMSTFEKRPKQTGVLLAGEKGSGKSLLAKRLSILGRERDIATIVVATPFAGDAFFKWMQTISWPCVVLFDEFEKVYKPDQQESILTLLDGLYDSKKLFVLTCNDTKRIDINMINRPGRIYYYMSFEGLEDQFVKEYCEDQLENKSHIDKVLLLKSMFESFNFDMLQAMVEEMNRYNEDPATVLEILNIRPNGYIDRYYHTELYSADKKLMPLIDKTWEGDPLGDAVWIELNYLKLPEAYQTTLKEAARSEDDDISEWVSFDLTDDQVKTYVDRGTLSLAVNLKFDPSVHLVQMDVTSGTYILQHPMGFTLAFKKKYSKPKNYKEYLKF